MARRNFIIAASIPVVVDAGEEWCIRTRESVYVVGLGWRGKPGCSADHEMEIRLIGGTTQDAFPAFPQIPPQYISWGMGDNQGTMIG